VSKEEHDTNWWLGRWASAVGGSSLGQERHLVEWAGTDNYSHAHQSRVHT